MIHKRYAPRRMNPIMIKKEENMKRRFVKKLFAAVLAASMMVSLVACGDSNDEKPSDDQASENTDNQDAAEDEDGYTVITDENGDPIDLGGIVIVIRDWYSTGQAQEPTNEFEEARDEYYAWVQDTYNFSITALGMSDYGSVGEDFINYASTGGDDKYYLFMLYPGDSLVAAMNSELMYDLSTLDCLDFTEEKWQSSSLHKLCSKDGAIYGMQATEAEPSQGIYFNVRLLEDAGYTAQDLYDLQENGEWTWDKFEEICKKVQADTNNDGIIDRYAMTNSTGYFYDAAVFSNNGQYIGMDENGKYYNALETNETLDAINWAYRMLNTYDMPQPEGTSWDYWIQAFKTGKAAFISGYAYSTNAHWSDMSDDFGFVCFPKGPAADDYTNVPGGNPYVIPACYDAEKAWAIAFAYDVYSQPIPGYEDYSPMLNGFYKSFRDIESVDLTLARMMENGKIDYSKMIPGVNISDDVFFKIDEDNSPAQAAEAVRNAWNTAIEKANSGE